LKHLLTPSFDGGQCGEKTNPLLSPCEDQLAHSSFISD
jgi:hypothetical protein